MRSGRFYMDVDATKYIYFLKEYSKTTLFDFLFLNFKITKLFFPMSPSFFYVRDCLYM